MGWLSSSLGSGSRFARGGAQAHDLARRNTELIRMALLQMLNAGDAGDAPGSLTRRVRYAANAERLWYLRSEVMTALASSQGEAVARDKLGNISGLFREVLPASLASHSRTFHPQQPQPRKSP